MGSFPGYDPRQLKDLPIVVSLQPGQNTGPAFLGSLVDIVWIETETALTRQDRSDVIYLDLYPSPGKEKTVRKLVADFVRNDDLYGISRADESVFIRYRIALAATVVLVLLLLYLTLGAQFESFSLPLILMLSVPFSLAGAGPALILSGTSLDLDSLFGLVALFGLSVNNGLIFFEISDQNLRSGMLPVKAVYSGAIKRFRPVMLTTLTTIFALLPLVISPFGNSQRSMASTLMGGIIVSGLLAFFALPPIFVWFLKARVKRGNYDR